MQRNYMGDGSLAHDGARRSLPRDMEGTEEEDAAVDIGDPLAGLLDERADESEGDDEAFGEGRQLPVGELLWLDEAEGELEPDDGATLEVGALVPAMAELELDDAGPEAPIAGFLEDDWSALTQDDAADDLSDDTVSDGELVFGVTEALQPFAEGDADEREEAEVPWALPSLAFEREDTTVTLSSRPWLACPIADVPLEALVLVPDALIAAGSELLRVERDAELGGNKSVSLRVRPPWPLTGVGLWRGELLCASVVGSLFRYSPQRGFELETTLHELSALATDAAVTWRLTTLAPGSFGPGIALLCSNGHYLLARRDARIEPTLSDVLALGSGEPPSLVQRTDAGVRLLELTRDGASFVASELPFEEAGAETLLCRRGEHIALWHPTRGLWLSDDGGQSYATLSGTGGVTALHFAEVNAAVALFAAVATDAPSVRVLAIDPARRTLECIAEIDPTLEREPETQRRGAAGPVASEAPSESAERDDWVARALVWDPTASVLWVAGSCGLLRLIPP